MDAVSAGMAAACDYGEQDEGDLEMNKTNEVRLIDANALNLNDVSCYYGTNVHLESVQEWIDDAPTINLNTLRDAVYQDAVEHGLWESTDYTVQLCINDYMECKEPFDKDELLRGWAMQVIRREVDELEHASEDAEAYAEELGDVIIAALSVAGKLGIDIDAAVKRKMEINRARPWKHGKGE